MERSIQCRAGEPTMTLSSGPFRLFSMKYTPEKRIRLTITVFIINITHVVRLGGSLFPKTPAFVQWPYHHAPPQFDHNFPKEASRLFGQPPESPAHLADPQTSRCQISATLDSIGLSAPADYRLRRLRIFLRPDLLGRERRGARDVSFRPVPFDWCGRSFSAIRVGR